jgi:hypothetical protein
VAQGNQPVVVLSAALLFAMQLGATELGSVPRVGDVRQRRSAAQIAYASSCSALNALPVRRLQVSDAVRMERGEFIAPADVRRGVADDVFRDLPELCRLTASPTAETAALTPMEVWLPTRSWNGRLSVFGPGTQSRRPDYAAMSLAARRGDGVVSVDAAGRRDPLTPVAIREVVLAAGDLVRGYFGVGPAAVSWSGCGEDAWAGLQTAQRFPADVDAVLAVGLPPTAVTSVDDFDLAAFVDRGGKILIYQQAGAAAVYDRVTRTPAGASAVRMFVADGDIRCEPRVVTLLTDALARWVEDGRPPVEIVLPPAASVTPPLLCAHPRVPVDAGRAADGRPRYVCRATR